MRPSVHGGTPVSLSSSSLALRYHGGMPQLAVYAGSFDPPTNGHAWMIEQSAKLFDRLIVAVARNPEKNYSYSLEQRLEWLRSMCAPHGNVEVASIENEFLARYAGALGAEFIVRGIRDEDDYRYERGMRYINSDLQPGMSTVFLMPPRELCEISSSFVKGMIGHKGWEHVVQGYVPSVVFDGLK